MKLGVFLAAVDGFYLTGHVPWLGYIYQAPQRRLPNLNGP